MTFKSIMLAAALLGGLASGAVAQEKAGGGLGVVCKAEMASLCPSDGKTGPFVCLLKNQAKLGPECASYVKTAEDRRTKFRVACEADRAKLCKDVEAKGGKMMQCLHDKQAELSKPCAEAVAALPGPAAKEAPTTK